MDILKAIPADESLMDAYVAELAGETWLKRDHRKSCSYWRGTYDFYVELLFLATIVS